MDVVDKRGKSVINMKNRPNTRNYELIVRLDGKSWYVVQDRNGKAKC